MLFNPFEWMIAGRYLRARRRERFISLIAILSVVGIALGVMVLIVVMSVMNGFQATMINQIIGINGHLLAQGSARGLAQYEALADRIQTYEGVAQVRPMIHGQVMASADGRAQGAMVRGIRAQDFKNHLLLTDGLKAGDANNFAGDDAVLLGDRLAQNLGVGVGDAVTLISPDGTATPFGTAPRMRDYQVVGLFNIGMYEYNANAIFMPLDQAQTFFRLGDAVHGLDVVLANPGQTAAVQRALYAELPANVQVFSWRDLNASFVGALEVERNTMFVILVLIIFVAAFNIMSSLIMLVKEKSKDIAVLRTMGARRRAVMRIFILAGGLMGVVGTGAGVLLGFVLLTWRNEILGFLGWVFNTRFFPPDVYGLEALPAQTDWVEVLITVATALGLSLVATLYPSWRAARLDPVEALRYE